MSPPLKRLPALAGVTLSSRAFDPTRTLNVGFEFPAQGIRHLSDALIIQHVSTLTSGLIRGAKIKAIILVKGKHVGLLFVTDGFNRDASAGNKGVCSLGRTRCIHADNYAGSGSTRS